MHSLAEEIQRFSKAKLKKRCTRVTTVTGRRLLETRGDGSGVQELEQPAEAGVCGFVQDNSLDLQVGVIRPFLLLASQDAAQDIDTLRKYKVSHVLNVAYGVENSFPGLLLYQTVTILDLPDTDILSYLPDCCRFIHQASGEGGVVLVHCNAGVSRSTSIVIGYLMTMEGLAFDDAFALVKHARPSVRPNPGFHQQLKNYKPRIPSTAEELQTFNTVS